MKSALALLLRLQSWRAAAQQPRAAVTISELMYHPPDPAGPEIALGVTDAKKFEYIKLTATGPLRLAPGAQFTDGVSFTFDQAWDLDAGDFLVIADDQAGFEARYGPPDPTKFACCFSGSLANGGETVVLSDGSGSELARAEYTDETPESDGGGAALAWLDGRWQPVEPSPHCRWPTEWTRDEPSAGPGELPAAAVIISEINYKPANSVVNEWRDSDRGGTCQTDFVYKRGGDLDEYIELHNPTTEEMDLAGWQVADGVSYTFPTLRGSAVIPAGGYLLLCRQDPEESGDSVTDPELCCHPPAAGLAASCCHRYAGSLSNSGERVTLLDGDSQIVEQVRYRSEHPWPESPDGYGRSLERLSGAAPPENPDSWAASTRVGGSPGSANSIGARAAAGVYVRRTPAVSPAQPAPGSDTAITLELDGTLKDSVASVRLQWILVPPQGTPTPPSTVTMVADGDGRYSVTLSPSACAGNCMLRYTLSVSVGGAEVRLPSEHDPLPCWSAFVTSSTNPPPAEGGHRLIIFGYPSPQTSELHHSLSGVVIWAPGEAEAQVFDGSTVELTKKNNLEIEFVKSNRWQGRDQLKVAVEAGVSGQGGEFGPIVEHWGYWLWANQPSSEVVVPLNSFMRVEIAGVEQQALVLGLYDSARMQEMGRGEDGDVWKRGFYQGYFTYKVTNFDERVLDLQKMIERLRTVTTGSRLSELSETAGIRVQSWLSFLSGCLLISNWDGYMNNHFIHQDAHGDGLWEIMPWDFDKTSGLQDPRSYAQRQDVDMPPQFGLDGHARVDARPPNSDGIASINKALLHHCEFAAAFRDLMELTSVWLGSQEVADALDAHEAAMLAQIAVMEEASGGTRRTSRRAAIADAHAGLRSYNRLRSAFLTGDEGIQCALQWCDGSDPGTSTLLSMVTATSTITRQGSGTTCVWDRAPPPPPRTSGRRRGGWGGSRAPVDCTRVGGLAAVGTGARVCSCCATEGASTELAPLAPGGETPAPVTCATEPTWSVGGDDSDPDGSDAPPSTAVGCIEDVDQDGRVGVGDLLVVLSMFGARDCCGSDPCGSADVSDDCAVSVADILLVLAAYGMRC